jgi:hypothetical protein
MVAVPGVLIPLMCVLLIVVPLIVVAVVLLVIRATKRKPEWEINPDEVDLGEPLGMGGCVCSLQPSLPHRVRQLTRCAVQVRVSVQGQVEGHRGGGEDAALAQPQQGDDQQLQG